MRKWLVVALVFGSVMSAPGALARPGDQTRDAVEDNACGDWALGDEPLFGLDCDEFTGLANDLVVAARAKVEATCRDLNDLPGPARPCRPARQAANAAAAAVDEARDHLRHFVGHRVCGDHEFHGVPLGGVDCEEFRGLLNDLEWAVATKLDAVLDDVPGHPNGG